MWCETEPQGPGGIKPLREWETLRTDGVGEVNQRANDHLGCFCRKGPKPHGRCRRESLHPTRMGLVLVTGRNEDSEGIRVTTPTTGCRTNPLRGRRAMVYSTRFGLAWFSMTSCYSSSEVAPKDKGGRSLVLLAITADYPSVGRPQSWLSLP
jgi:hypothetical protein